MGGAYTKRLLALAAATPAARAPPGMLESAEAMELADAVREVLRDAERSLVEILQAAVDFQRGSTVANDSTGLFFVHSGRGIRAALARLGDRAPGGALASRTQAPVRAFLHDCMVVDFLFDAQFEWAAGRPPPAASVRAQLEETAAAGAAWAEPAAAAGLAARLAELGVARGAHAAADLRHALLYAAAELIAAFDLGGERFPGLDATRLLEQALEANPEGPMAAARLAIAYADRSRSEGLAVACVMCDRSSTACSGRWTGTGGGCRARFGRRAPSRSPKCAGNGWTPRWGRTRGCPACAPAQFPSWADSARAPAAATWRRRCRSARAAAAHRHRSTTARPRASARTGRRTRPRARRLRRPRPRRAARAEPALQKSML
jgi:hypothetical protein